MKKNEIKFRAFHKVRREMYDVYAITKEHVFSDTLDGFDGSPDDLLEDVELLEYIGIKDKNGVEIYEGDYLVDLFPIDEDDLSKGYNESLFPVVWCNENLQWCIDNSFAKNGSSIVSLVEYFGEHLEVKGNIYEN